MGCRFEAQCLKCKETFEVDNGGGFAFHMLRCDHCGASKSIGFDEIGEPHLQYLKGLPGPYCVASSAHDASVKKNYPGEAIFEEEYHKKVEILVGKCGCGGQFKFDAPIRCPKCHSRRVKEGRTTMMYD